MLKRFVISTLALAALVGIGTSASANRGVKVFGMNAFHASFSVADGRDRGTVISQNLQRLTDSSFQNASAPSVNPLPLQQLVSTVAAQAQAQHWKAFTVDAWVAGRAAPVAYFIDYSATDDRGSAVRGQAEIAVDRVAVMDITDGTLPQQ